MNGGASDLVSAVLLQTVQQAAGVGQPERRHLKVIVVFLSEKKKPEFKHLNTPEIRQVEEPRTRSHLQDLLDGVDGGGEKRLHLLVVVDIVGVADAHEEDVSREAGDGRRHRAGLHVWKHFQHISNLTLSLNTELQVCHEPQ